MAKVKQQRVNWGSTRAGSTWRTDPYRVRNRRKPNLASDPPDPPTFPQDGRKKVLSPDRRRPPGSQCALSQSHRAPRRAQSKGKQTRIQSPQAGEVGTSLTCGDPAGRRDHDLGRRYRAYPTAHPPEPSNSSGPGGNQLNLRLSERLLASHHGRRPISSLLLPSVAAG